MDSDVTADSLSSPEHGDNSTNQRGSGFGSLQSFSTQGPPGHTSSQRSSNAALDSFDLSPATDASTGGGGFLERSSRQQHSSSSLRDVGGLTPLSESLRSSHLLSHDDGEYAAEKDFPQLSEIGTRGSVEIDNRRPRRRDEHVVVAVSPLETNDAGQRLRKRSREAATTNGRGDSAGWQQLRKHRLQSSWPIFRDRSAGGEGSQWDMSQPSHSPSSSQREGTASTGGSPRDRPGMLHEPTSSPRTAAGRVRAALYNRFPRRRNGNDGESASRRSGSKAIGGVGGSVGGAHGNSNGTSVASSDGIGETFSVASEVSSGGLPPPPVMPSGPLPAIGVIGEYFLTRSQQQHLDHERRLTADHMRRLNQVLAGHLPYREVSKVHAEGRSHQVLHAAPSHGSDVEYSPPVDDSRDAEGNACWRPPKQSVLRRLVLRVARNRTKDALTRGWIRMWRLSAGAKENSATTTNSALTHVSHAKERAELTRDDRHEEGRHRQRKGDTLDRFQQGTTIVDRIFRDRRRRSVFRGWSRLCLHAASLSAAEGASAAATALARAARAEAMEKEAQASAEKAEAWRKAADASAKVAASREEAHREAARGSILVAELERRKVDISRLESEGQLRRTKLLIIRMSGERDRALMFRAWSRLCLHAASLSAAEGASATARAIARAARTEAMEKDAQAAIEHAEATKRAAATSVEVAAAREKAKHETARGSMLTAELQHMEEDMSRAEREHQLRRTKCLFTRVCSEREKALMFRGWSRLCMHAASLSAAEGASAAATALARAARAEAMEKEAKFATRHAVMSMEVAAAREKSWQEPANGHGSAAELRLEVQDAGQSQWKQDRRRAKLLITRVCGERDRALVFRGWSRLCMHASSLSAAEGASAAATALARAARTKAMEKEAQAASEKVEAWRKAAAASSEVAAAREQAQRENARGSVLTAELKNKEMEMSRVEKQHQLRRMKMLITRVCAERDRALVFRGWSRLCLHAASLTAAEGDSAAACAAARAARSKAMEVEAQAATEKAEALKRAAAASADLATAKEQASQGNQLRRVKLMITRLCRERDKNLVLRGWVRLRLNTASSPAAEGGPTAANVSRTVSRADATKKDAQAGATVSTDVVAERNRAKEEVDCKVASVSERAEEDMSWRTRRATTAISRVLKGKDRRLLFRGWSRLCLHAASLNAADAAAATATAAARASRAEAEEKEAVMAQTAAGIATDAAAVRQRVEAAELDAKEQRERRALQLIGGSVRDNNRRLLYHGWSRLCLHTMSCNVAHNVAGVSTEAASGHEKAVHTRAERSAKRAEEAESALGAQRRQQAVRLIARVCTARNKMSLFRGWSRLRLHAASLAAASRDPAGPATARAASIETTKMHESIPPESTKEHRRGTSAPSDGESEVGDADAHVRAAPAAPEEARRAEGALRHRGGRLIARICARRDARLLSRGWTRVCMHAARLHAAEAAKAATRAIARAAGEEVAETVARANTQEAKASKKGAVAISELAAAAEERRQDTARGSMSAPELTVNVQETNREAREHQLRWINILITRACGERDRALMFRGWSRLCLHATSLSAEEGASAAACALARATRAEALQKEAQATIEKAATGTAMVSTRQQPQLTTARGSISAADRRPGGEEPSRAEREHQLRWIGILVARVSGEKHKALLFRGWSRLCLHAASLSAAEGVSASVTVSARAARAEAMEKEAKVDSEKAESSEEVAAATGEGQREIIYRSALAEDLERGGEAKQPAVREHQLRRAKTLIIRVCRERDRASMFRGWTRLCLHAASLSAAEGASAAACAVARAARTEAMEKEARAATEKAEAWSRAAAASAEVAAAREQAKRSSIGVSVLTAELNDREKNTAQMVREHHLRRMKMLISRVCGKRDRTLMFRGWSRICLHAASLCAAEGASAAATAVARAARADAMEKEVQAEAENSAEWRKATAASLDMVATSGNVQREAADGSISAAELKLKLNNTEQILRDTQLRRTKLMITRVCGERDRALMFRGWSRLCMHAASLSAAEGASAAATALARAARAEAMRMEAQMAADKAETRQRAASDSKKVVAAGEQADGESAQGSISLVEPEQEEKGLEPVVREQQLRRMKMLITRGCGERDRALVFRGWSRLCLHAASRSAVKEASAVTGANAIAVRSSVLEEEANTPPEEAVASAETPRGSTSPAVSKHRESHPSNLERKHQLCLMKMMFTRVCSERDRALMSRGWNRLHSKTTSVSVVEADSPTAAAFAEADEAGVAEREAGVATGDPAAGEEIAAGSQTNEEPARGSTLVAELRLKVKDTEQALQRQYLRRAKTLITRVCGERDRALIFRGWSRLCLHAASLSAAEGASAAATALARAARAEAMEKEAQAAADKAEAWRKAAAASAEVAAAREQAQREAVRGSALVAAEVKSREEGMSQAEREHQLRRMRMLVVRVCGEKDRALIFRGWSRLCLHAASLSAAEGASAAATALARAARAEAMEKEAQAAADKAEAWSKAAAASAEVAAAREQAQREAVRGSALVAAEVKSREEGMSQAEREHQLRRMKMLITRVCGERDRALIFRGWSRLCLHAASLSAAEGASAAATALARAARAEAMEKEAQAAADKAEAWSKAAAASAEVAAAREQAQREAVRGSALVAAEVKSREEGMSQAEREHQLRRMRMLVARVCGERDRALIFRGWSRLCLHAASLSAAEGASAAATALARAARAEAMEKEAQAAADKAEAWSKAAAASAEVAAAREQAQREAVRGSALVAAEVKSREEGMSQAEREHQLRRMKMLITRVCGERDRALIFRGWSRLCLHAASLSAAEGASAAAAALARAARAEAMEKEAQAAADKAEAWRKAAAASAEVAAAREQAQREAVRGSTLAAEVKSREEGISQADREHQLRRMRMLITRVCGERDRALIFRGWSRLCLHAASLSAAEGASAAAAALARAARAEAMEKEAQAAADKAEAWSEAAAASAEVAAAREQAQREAVRGSALVAAEVKSREEGMSQADREHQLRRMKLLIMRVCNEQDRALIFRGWSRLCLHAASLSAAEGASAAATALARAARAEAMEKEAQAAADKAEAWSKAAAASAEVAAAREQAQREAVRGSALVAAEVKSREEGMSQADREHQLRRMRMLIARACGERDRARMFRGWSRLCLHSASLCAAEGASAAATALARAARAEAMEGKAADATKTAADKTHAADLTRRKISATVMVLKLVLKMERRAIARGWARLTEAAAASTALTACEEGTQEMGKMEAYAIDLQRKAAKQGRELSRKTRALAILLRDDWAKVALERERETRAARLQLAQAEGELATQLNSMAGLAPTGSGLAVAHNREVPGRGKYEGGERVGGGEEDRRAAEGVAEVFLGEAGGGIGMVALQGEGARRLRAYVAGKGRDLKRARVESEQWRARCEGMQRRLHDMLDSKRGGTAASAFSTQGKRLAAVLLNMLDERDRRLSNLCEDLVYLSMDGHSGEQPSSHKEGGRRREARRKAGRFLLRQMAAAGEEARTHIHRLSDEVQRLEVALRVASAHASTPREADFGRQLSEFDENDGKAGAEGEGREGTSTRGRGVLVEAVSTTPSNQDGRSYPLADVDHGVQAATDAHELVSSLRSEVAALERHCATLQAELGRLEGASAGIIDQTAASASWAKVAATKRGQGGSSSAFETRKSISNHDGDGNLKGRSSVANPDQSGSSTKEIAIPRGKAGKRARVERRVRAAEVLREAFGCIGGETNIKRTAVGSAAESEEARAVDFAREARQMAQENFAPRRAAET